MSENYQGVTFSLQKVAPTDDAIIRRAILSDGILTGCKLSYSGSTLTMAPGQLIICGRQIRHAATQNWAVRDATSGLARIVLTVDLTRTASKDAFDQVVDEIQYADSPDGFPPLEMADINLAGTKYQVVLCVVTLGPGGITGIAEKIDESHPPGSGLSTIFVTAPEDTTGVTAAYGGKTKNGKLKDGKWVLSGLEYGPGVVWTVTATNGIETATIQQPMERLEIAYVNIVYQYLPEFTYTGDFVVIEDPSGNVLKNNNTESPEYVAYRGHYKIKLLTSGVLNFKSLGGLANFENTADVFFVGGGAGTSAEWSGDYGAAGGGSGYTQTVNVSLNVNTDYPIVIGGGGNPGSDGGQTSGFGQNISGGHKPYRSSGGSGGSGGGNFQGHGGSDGSDGNPGGKGQGTTTREFGDSNGVLYSGAGSGSWYSGGPYNPGPGGTTSQGDGKPNTGASGSGGAYPNVAHAGGSGIVILRDPRGV